MGLSGFRARNHSQQTAKREPSLFGEDETDVTDDRATPQRFFDELDKQFRFTLDAAASAANAKCEQFYTLEDDGLSVSWAQQRVWCNPPYSNLGRWVNKAWGEWKRPEPPALIVMLLPANRTEQDWWQLGVEPFRDRPGSDLTVTFVRGRLRFVQAGKEGVAPNERPPFGCCLLIWQRAVYDGDRWKAAADQLAAATRRALEEYDRCTTRLQALRVALAAHDALTAETEWE